LNILCAFQLLAWWSTKIVILENPVAGAAKLQGVVLDTSFDK
jgi:hypothetical protein